MVAQSFMEIIAAKGAEYGLALNWSKVELLKVRSTSHLQGNQGHVKEVDSMVYLGGLLSADGSVDKLMQSWVQGARESLETWELEPRQEDVNIQCLRAVQATILVAYLGAQQGPNEKAKQFSCAMLADHM